MFYQVRAFSNVDRLRERERPVSSTNLWETGTRIFKLDKNRLKTY
jgi:hypothetical protein